MAAARRLETLPGAPASHPRMSDPILSADPAQRKRTIGGIVFALLGLVCGYFFMYQPVHQAQTTGQLTYYLRGILLPPFCFYLAFVMLFTKFKDGEMRKLDARGKPTLTAKGYWIFGGAIVFMLVTVVLWYAYIHALGFHEAP